MGVVNASALLEDCVTIFDAQVVIDLSLMVNFRTPVPFDAF